MASVVVLSSPPLRRTTDAATVPRIAVVESADIVIDSRPMLSLHKLSFLRPLAVPRRRGLIIYTIAMLGLAIPFAAKKVSEWDIVFIPTAAHLLAGEDIYVQP